MPLAALSQQLISGKARELRNMTSDQLNGTSSIQCAWVELYRALNFVNGRLCTRKTSEDVRTRCSVDESRCEGKKLRDNKD